MVILEPVGLACFKQLGKPTKYGSAMFDFKSWAVFTLIDFVVDLSSYPGSIQELANDV